MNKHEFQLARLKSQYLIVLMIIMGIIALTIWLLWPRVSGVDEEYYNRYRVIKLTELVIYYEHENNILPTSESWESQIIKIFDPHGEAEFRKLFKDSWDNSIIYDKECEGHGNKLCIYSVGPNGVDDKGDGDDILGWNVKGMAERIKQIESWKRDNNNR